MKDAKTFSLLFLSLILLFASFILLFTWGYYQFFYKNQGGNPKTQPVAKNSINIDDNYRDSVQEIDVATIKNINTRLESTLGITDSLQFDSYLKPSEFYKLKNEILSILKNHPLKADLDIAHQKITELQYKLAELNNRNINAQDENKRLNGRLSQLSMEIKDVDQNIKSSTPENKIVTKNENTSSDFTISQIRLSALRTSGTGDQETTQAEQTEKLIGSFIVKNNTHVNNAEIIVAVLQPDGRVLQNSTWESGTFQTHEGRKIYSSKLPFDYTQGEAKRLSFTLSTDKFQKGEYTMQVYYNGMNIGNAFKNLY